MTSPNSQNVWKNWLLVELTGPSSGHRTVCFLGVGVGKLNEPCGSGVSHKLIVPTQINYANDLHSGTLDDLPPLFRTL